MSKDILVTSFSNSFSWAMTVACISRTEANAQGPAPFQHAFELGIFYGSGGFEIFEALLRQLVVSSEVAHCDSKFTRAYPGIRGYNKYLQKVRNKRAVFTQTVHLLVLIIRYIFA